MSKRKSPARSSRPRRTHVTPLPGLSPSAELLKRIQRSRVEREMIARALRDAPLLDQEAEASEVSPYNSAASSEEMQRALLRIVYRRLEGTPWVDAFRALQRTDFATLLDTYRDAVFMAGVEYAQRSLPAWWSSFSSLDDNARQMFGLMIASAATKEGE